MGGGKGAKVTGASLCLTGGSCTSVAPPIAEVCSLPR